MDWLPKSVTVQLWRGWMPEVAQRVASLGLASIVSAELYLDWARSIKHYYKHDVRPSRGRIGGEACMWSEWASDNVDNRLWPTLAAVAEKLWLSAEAPGGVPQMYARVFGVSAWLAGLGLRHDSVYDLALRALLSGKPFSYAQVAAHRRGPEDLRLAPLRRLTNALQPVNRVGGGQKHPLVQFADVLRPDSLEMRALALLAEQCVAERFAEPGRAALLRASLALYARLPAELEACGAAAAVASAGAAHLAKDVAEVAAAAVELIDLLARGEAATAQTRRQSLLARIAQIENAVVGGDKVIVEFAHVVETSLCVRI